MAKIAPGPEVIDAGPLVQTAREGRPEAPTPAPAVAAPRAEPAHPARQVDEGEPLPRRQLRALGALLVISGVAGLVATAVWAMAAAARSGAGAPGDLPAVSLLLVTLGVVAAFPSLLTGGGKGFSTMRVAVLAVVCAFVLVTVKSGWQTSAIDRSWIQVLLAALGAKVAQSFAEGLRPRRDGGPRGSP